MIRVSGAGGGNHGPASPRDAAALQAKRRFQRHALIYAVVIGLLVVIWALTNFGNYFWPIWPALLWGIALGIHAWTVYGQRPITDADIDRELGRDRRPDQSAGG